MTLDMRNGIHNPPPSFPGGFQMSSWTWNMVWDGALSRVGWRQRRGSRIRGFQGSTSGGRVGVRIANQGKHVWAECNRSTIFAPHKLKLQVGKGRKKGVARAGPGWEGALAGRDGTQGPRVPGSQGRKRRPQSISFAELREMLPVSASGWSPLCTRVLTVNCEARGL